MGEMKGNGIRYLKGMKYVLSDDHRVLTPIKGADIIDPWFRLQPDGALTIFMGFAWDGPSGPTFDTKDSLRASLVHDVFCILMRDGRIDFERQDAVNEFFRQMCIEDGMPEWRARVWFWGVEIGDAGNPDQGPDRIVQTAP